MLPSPVSSRPRLHKTHRPINPNLKLGKKKKLEKKRSWKKLIMLIPFLLLRWEKRNRRKFDGRALTQKGELEPLYTFYTSENLYKILPSVRSGPIILFLSFLMVFNNSTKVGASYWNDSHSSSGGSIFFFGWDWNQTDNFLYLFSSKFSFLNQKKIRN